MEDGTNTNAKNSTNVTIPHPSMEYGTNVGTMEHRQDNAENSTNVTIQQPSIEDSTNVGTRNDTAEDNTNIVDNSQQQSIRQDSNYFIRVQQRRNMLPIAMPIGYRFVPTDEELVRFYLIEKVLEKPNPVGIIEDIDAAEFYSKSPQDLVANLNDRERYFFMRQSEDVRERKRPDRVVRDGLGFWKAGIVDIPIHNLDGQVFAFRRSWTFFRATLEKPRKTLWNLEEFRLPANPNTNKLQKDEYWVLVKLKKGKNPAIGN